MNNDAFLSLFSQRPVREIVTDDEDAVLDGDFGMAEHEADLKKPACVEDAVAPKDEGPSRGNAVPDAVAAPSASAAPQRSEVPTAGLEDEPEIDGPLSWEMNGGLDAPVDSCTDWDEEIYLDGAFGAPDGQPDWSGAQPSTDWKREGMDEGRTMGASDAPGSSDAAVGLRDASGERASPSPAANAAQTDADDLERWLDAPPDEIGDGAPEDIPQSLTSAANRVLLADLGEVDAASIERSLDEWGLIPRPQPRPQEPNVDRVEPVTRDVPGEKMTGDMVEEADNAVPQRPSASFPQVTYDWALSVGNPAADAVEGARADEVLAAPAEQPLQPASQTPREGTAPPPQTWIHLEPSQPIPADEGYLDGAVGTFTPFEALLDGTYEPVLGAEDIDVTTDKKGDPVWKNAR